MKKREIKKQYAEMLAMIEKEPTPNNHVNCYVCKTCGEITKTVDVDKGVTPFMHLCAQDGCDGFGTSTFYKDIAPDLEPVEEWFRPTLKETIALRKKEPGMLDHILQGGLDVRQIKSKHAL